MKRLRINKNGIRYISHETNKELKVIEEKCWRAVAPLLRKYDDVDVEQWFNTSLNLRFALARIVRKKK